MLAPAQALQGAGGAAEISREDNLLEGPGGTAGLLWQAGFHSQQKCQILYNAAEGKVLPWQWRANPVKQGVSLDWVPPQLCQKMLNVTLMYGMCDALYLDTFNICVNSWCKLNNVNVIRRDDYILTIC